MFMQNTSVDCRAIKKKKKSIKESDRFVVSTSEQKTNEIF